MPRSGHYLDCPNRPQVLLEAVRRGVGTASGSVQVVPAAMTSSIPNARRDTSTGGEHARRGSDPSHIEDETSKDECSDTDGDGCEHARHSGTSGVLTPLLGQFSGCGSQGFGRSEHGAGIMRCLPRPGTLLVTRTWASCKPLIRPRRRVGGACCGTCALRTSGVRRDRRRGSSAKRGRPTARRIELPTHLRDCGVRGATHGDAGTSGESSRPRRACALVQLMAQRSAEPLRGNPVALAPGGAQGACIG